jgi:hypothetical protein
MASIVTTTVVHVPTGYVTDITDIVQMDVLKALKDTVVIRSDLLVAETGVLGENQ